MRCTIAIKPLDFKRGGGRTTEPLEAAIILDANAAMEKVIGVDEALGTEEVVAVAGQMWSLTLMATATTLEIIQRRHTVAIIIRVY